MTSIDWRTYHPLFLAPTSRRLKRCFSIEPTPVPMAPAKRQSLSRPRHREAIFDATAPVSAMSPSRRNASKPHLPQDRTRFAHLCAAEIGE